MILSKRDCVGVIGGGLGGLAAACTLAARGHRVVLLEKNARIGGNAAHVEQAGFRFDLLPCISSAPGSLHRIFAEAGERLEDYLTLTRLDPQWRSFFPDGKTLDLTADPARMAANLELFAGQKTTRGFCKLMRWAGRLDQLLQRSFFWKTIESWRDMVTLHSLFQPAALAQLALLSTTPSRLIRCAVANPQLRQLLIRLAEFAGLEPWSSPAMLCGIANLQIRESVWYPQGGISAIPAALERLALELGVEILPQTCVRRIIVRDGALAQVEGVETAAGEKIRFSAIVANSDAVQTHRELLRGTRAGTLFKNRRGEVPTPSAAVLYLGLNKRYEHLLLHNFVFSGNPAQESEFVHQRGQPAPDPTCYLRAPAALDASVAPPGGEALSVLIQAPYLRAGHDWSKLLPACRKQIISKLKKEAGLGDIEERIVTEHALTPREFARDHHLRHGALYGLASRSRFFGAFKPGNRSAQVRGLYFAGSSVHPGPGMELMSGWIAADALDDDYAGAAPEFAEPEVAEL